MSRTAVIVQARMASTRLPGKVLLPLAGTTVLDQVLTRCAAIGNADVVVCAVPDKPDNDLVAEEAMRIGARTGALIFRGSESDVLDRYYRAARFADADVVLRVTSDCPLIDPTICARVIELLTDEGADYAANNMSASWPHGLDCEAVRFSWLQRAAQEATQPFDREHVTPFVRTHPDAKKANLNGPGGDMVRHRWTLDTPADLEFMIALFKKMPTGEAAWSFDVPLNIVKANPSLAAINAADNTRLPGHATA
jgi:spore coat polysaccharide biosynthesis protein SpsF